MLVYFGLLKSNLSIVRRLASLRLHGCSGVIVCSVSPTSVYVLARRFLCPVSCLTCAAAQFLKKAVPADALYNSKASVLLVSLAYCSRRVPECSRGIPELKACFTFAHSAGPPGDQNVRTYIDRGHVQFDSEGLTPIMCKHT